jgi:Domain of unknown function (DUF4832)/Domain of unknown function (DUF4874)/Secretion system C-terminal sorting domain
MTKGSITFHLALSLLFAAIFQVSPAQFFPPLTVTYETDTTNFPNPERGMVTWTATMSSNPGPLSTGDLEYFHDVKGQRIVFRYFYLDSFINQPISEEFLQIIEDDFDKIRTAGMKCVIRFAYIDHYLNTDEFGSPIPPFGDSPSHAQLLQHIAQLTPITLANSDIILTLQNGFWGIWGENYYSDVYGCSYFASITAEQWLQRKEVTDNVLNMVDQQRMISLRYPLLKQNFYNLTLPEDSITNATAYNGSALSRLGGHNDCFLVEYNDYTYSDTLTEKPFWATESGYTIMGGETCGLNPEYGNCANTIHDMERFHWTYLNDYYHPDVIDNWEAEGCFDEIQKRLGYRISLVEATFTQSTIYEEPFNVSITLKNDGFSPPVHAHNVALILRNTANIQVELPLNIDLRLLRPGHTQTYQFEFISSQNWVGEPYHFYLEISDPYPSLSEIADYNIRLANVDTWLPDSGWNDLQAEIMFYVISVDENESNRLRVFPNPVENQLNITGRNAFRILRVEDIFGKVVFSKGTQALINHTLDLADLSPGLYFVVTESNGKLQRISFVKN